MRDVSGVCYCSVERRGIGGDVLVSSHGGGRKEIEK